MVFMFDLFCFNSVFVPVLLISAAVRSNLFPTKAGKGEAEVYIKRWDHLVANRGEGGGHNPANTKFIKVTDRNLHGLCLPGHKKLAYCEQPDYGRKFDNVLTGVVVGLYWCYVLTDRHLLK